MKTTPDQVEQIRTQDNTLLKRLLEVELADLQEALSYYRQDTQYDLVLKGQIKEVKEFLSILG